MTEPSATPGSPEHPNHGRDPALRTFAMPADTNPNGDVFGGWVLAQMDLAGAIAAVRTAQGRVATVGIEAMSFHRPVLVGDEVSCYTKVLRIGRTSIQIQVDMWVRRYLTGEDFHVTEGVFSYVAIGADRKPRPILQAPAGA
jgi:acyl-CoA thioesterase YciA